ncbi:hypothetical protein [Candidatus Vondammii sp. HM_W22]|nr:hypothetical protein [Candidatus Vondammii sp. HM_W22]
MTLLIRRVHRVGFIVVNIETALDFCRSLLGLKVLDNRPDLGYPGA